MTARLEAERAAQGLPDRIEDEGVLARVAAIVVTAVEDHSDEESR